jgi:hypothetical protein
MYVIVLTEYNGRYPAGYYVADMNKNRSGGGSYTRSLQNAKVFSTREQAEGERCPGNEIVMDVTRILR